MTQSEQRAEGTVDSSVVYTFSWSPAALEITLISELCSAKLSIMLLYICMYVCLLGAQLKVQTLTLEPRMRQATETSSQKFRWTLFYKICCYKLL